MPSETETAAAMLHRVGKRRQIPDTRLGRTLCRAGLHKWAFIQGTDPIDGLHYTQTIMSYCERPGCLEPIKVVDHEVFPHT